MVSSARESESQAQLERSRAAALSIGALAIAYVGVSLYYFWDDFFKFMEPGSPIAVDRAGIAVPVHGSEYLWTILSPWRILLAGVAVALLAVSAQGLWRRRPGARVLALISLWGVLLPQVLWYTEFVFDWYGGIGWSTIVLAGFAAAALPTLLLFEGRGTLAEWRPLSAGRARLLLTAIALGWIGSLAANILDHSYRLDSWVSYLAALAAIPLSALAITGIFKLRSWALWIGIAAAGSLAVTVLAFDWSGCAGGWGYLDSMVYATTGHDLSRLVTAAAPVALIWGLSAPFLHAFVRKALTEGERL
jgi:hypothetical protein